MEILITIFFGLLGACIGSFLNVIVDRVPAGKSIAYPPSSCDGCQHPLSFWDLFPVFSYILLRGRCRYCGAKIPIRVILVELGTGILTAYLYIHYGLVWMLPVAIIYCATLIAVAIIDLIHSLIFPVIIFPIAILAMIVNFFVPDLFSVHNLVFGFIGAASGSIFLLAALVLSKLILKREGMGLGDVYMAVMMGFMVGWPNIIVALFGGILLGGISAILLLVFKKKTRKEEIPFGDFLAIGTIVAMLWGSDIIHWYLRLSKLE
jgi:leader peptidase (prepilin peptidase)/N-methyltransferase